MSAYEVRLARAAARQFERLDEDGRQRIREALLRLAQEVAAPGRIPGNAARTIRGTEGVFHRLRVGDRRIMYDVLDDQRVVLVLGIVDRADLERWIRNR